MLVSGTSQANTIVWSLSSPRYLPISDLLCEGTRRLGLNAPQRKGIEDRGPVLPIHVARYASGGNRRRRKLNSRCRILRRPCERLIKSRLVLRLGGRTAHSDKVGRSDPQSAYREWKGARSRAFQCTKPVDLHLGWGRAEGACRVPSVLRRSDIRVGPERTECQDKGAEAEERFGSRS